ncbi:MAG: hypothetical protein WC604_00250 [Candidatus Gracilibacteria bacterium]
MSNTDRPVEQAQGGDTPSIEKLKRQNNVLAATTAVLGVIGVVTALCTGVLRDGIYERKNEKLTCNAIASGEDPNTQDFTVMLVPPAEGEALVPSLSASGHTKLINVVQEDVDLVVRGCKERYGIVVTPAQVGKAVSSFLPKTTVAPNP